VSRAPEFPSPDPRRTDRAEADTELRTADFDFFLPPECIADRPVARRDASRLMVLGLANAETTPPRHQTFGDLPDLLAPGDLLVLNDTRVFPARIRGSRAGGMAKVELLLLAEITADRAANGPATLRYGTGAITPPDAASPPPSPIWRAMGKGGGHRGIRPGDILLLNGNLAAEVVAAQGSGIYLIRFPRLSAEDLAAHLEAHGEIPLPPYIRRGADAADRERYQTVFAAESGSVAAPTSGLHFTPELLENLRARGVEIARVTLHVGPGTFLPVRAERLSEHTMHGEFYRVGEDAARAIEQARARGGKIVACGTTVTRALESAASEVGRVAAGAGESRLFIHPGYTFRVVDSLITNFHLPCSTLLMLVAAMAGRQRVLDAYAEAIGKGYRFYSYGDAMLIR